MTWLKIDDQVAFHAKTIAAGNAAFGAWVRLAAWSCAQLTDGHVPASAARTMASASELCRLVDAGLLDRSDDGFEVHNFLDWNPSADEVRAKRELDRERKAKGRAEQSRDNLGRISSKRPSGVRADNQRTLSGLAPESADPPPVPSPSPYPEQDLTCAVCAALGSRNNAHPPAAGTHTRGEIERAGAEPSRPSAASGPPRPLCEPDGSTEANAPENAVAPPARGSARASLDWDAAPSSPEAAELLAELRAHPVLADVATTRLAESLEGRRMTTARHVADVRRAISEAARDLAAEEAVSGPLMAHVKATKITRYADRARPPREATGRARLGDGGVRAALQQPAPPGSPLAWVESSGTEWMDEAAEAEAAAQKGTI